MCIRDSADTSRLSAKFKPGIIIHTKSPIINQPVVITGNSSMVTESQCFNIYFLGSSTATAKICRHNTILVISNVMESEFPHVNGLNQFKHTGPTINPKIPATVDSPMYNFSLTNNDIRENTDENTPTHAYATWAFETSSCSQTAIEERVFYVFLYRTIYP